MKSTTAVHTLAQAATNNGAMESQQFHLRAACNMNATARIANSLNTRTMRPACSSQVKTLLLFVPQKFHQTKIPLCGLVS